MWEFMQWDRHAQRHLMFLTDFRERLSETSNRVIWTVDKRVCDSTFSGSNLVESSDFYW